MVNVERWWQIMIDLEKEQQATIEVIKKMIKHPRFEYAVYNATTKKFKIKRKPLRQWFKNERIVHIVVNDFELQKPREYRKETKEYGNR